jgi:hypothetical protein
MGGTFLLSLWSPAMIRFALLCIACVTALAACAVPEQTEAEIYKAPVYRTGSNLPAGRESGESTEMTAADRKTLEDLQNRSRQPVVKPN